MVLIIARFGGGWGWVVCLSSPRRRGPSAFASVRRRLALLLASGEGLSAPSFRRKPESILPFAFFPRRPREGGDPAPSLFSGACRHDAAFVPVGFRPPSWRPGHFLCLHKESNQRNAPSVTRRPRSGRFAAVGRGLAAGLLPCRQMRAVLARTACGARGCFRPTFAASQRDPKAKEEKNQPKPGRWVPPSRGRRVCSLRSLVASSARRECTLFASPARGRGRAKARVRAASDSLDARASNSARRLAAKLFAQPESRLDELRQIDAGRDAHAFEHVNDVFARDVAGCAFGVRAAARARD